MTYLRSTVRTLGNDTATGLTPQGLPVPGTAQVPNDAGGYGWAVDDWARLRRFLILGTEGGTFYASEKRLTAENVNAVLRCLAADHRRVVDTAVEVSAAGRAPKNDPALLALALAASQGTVAQKTYALGHLSKVARTGTHLLHFAAFVAERGKGRRRGWGRGLRTAVARWYTQKPAGAVAYQAVKYQARDGWSQSALLKLAHPKPPTEQHRAVFHWMRKGWEGVGEEPHPDEALRLIWAFERAKRATTAGEVVRLIRDHRLPREGVPTQFLKEPAVWDALLEDMPLTAMVRNLATMTRVGLLKPLSQAAHLIDQRLTDAERLRASRVHPIALLVAQRVYAQGHGERSLGKDWQPVTRVVDALDRAFYLAFKNVEPTGLRWLLALDVSGSMGAGTIAGVPGLTPRGAAAALALVTANVEAQHHIVGFSAEGATHPQSFGHRFGQGDGDPDKGMSRLPISATMNLTTASRMTEGLPFGPTDCSLPMRWALKHKVEADVFVVLTDNETWAGPQHPVQALNQYRREMGLPARLVVHSMTAGASTVADPNDAGMLDLNGLDADAPALAADFARGLL